MMPHVSERDSFHSPNISIELARRLCKSDITRNIERVDSDVTGVKDTLDGLPWQVHVGDAYAAHPIPLKLRDQCKHVFSWAAQPDLGLNLQRHQTVNVEQERSDNLGHGSVDLRKGDIFSRANATSPLLGGDADRSKIDGQQAVTRMLRFNETENVLRIIYEAANERVEDVKAGEFRH
jgi:hypothetical protein